MFEVRFRPAKPKQMAQTNQPTASRSYERWSAETFLLGSRCLATLTPQPEYHAVNKQVDTGCNQTEPVILLFYPAGVATLSDLFETQSLLPPQPVEERTERFHVIGIEQ